VESCGIAVAAFARPITVPGQLFDRAGVIYHATGSSQTKTSHRCASRLRIATS
jgi:hypothetical protein